MLRIEDTSKNSKQVFEDSSSYNEAKHSSSTLCCTFTNDKRCRKKQLRVPATTSNLKEGRSYNRFSLLENCSKDDMDVIKMHCQLMSRPKSSLKKCRTCNFKKRICAISKTNCTSVGKICYACGKVGHFPKSLNCKKKEEDKSIFE